jgi:hypothetical protein
VSASILLALEGCWIDSKSIGTFDGVSNTAAHAASRESHFEIYIVFSMREEIPWWNQSTKSGGQVFRYLYIFGEAGPRQPRGIDV